MAPSLMMYTEEHVSDNAKSKNKVKHHLTVLHSTVLRSKEQKQESEGWWDILHEKEVHYFLICIF